MRRGWRPTCCGPSGRCSAMCRDLPRAARGCVGDGRSVDRRGAVRLCVGPRPARAGVAGRQWPGMDLPTRDRAPAHVAQVPPRQPGLHQPGDGAGTRSPGRRARAALALLVAFAAVDLAARNGVVGWRALPELLAVCGAAVGLFAVGGLGLTRWLLPAGQRRYELLWVLPVGACAVGLALTVLGFAHVPFKLSLAIVIGLGVGAALVAYRRQPGVPAVRAFRWPAYIAVLVAAVSLIPLFRAGFATVEGQGQDAHLA